MYQSNTFFFRSYRANYPTEVPDQIDFSTQVPDGKHLPTEVSYEKHLLTEVSDEVDPPTEIPADMPRKGQATPAASRPARCNKRKRTTSWETPDCFQENSVAVCDVCGIEFPSTKYRRHKDLAHDYKCEEDDCSLRSISYPSKMNKSRETS